MRITRPFLRTFLPGLIFLLGAIIQIEGLQAHPSTAKILAFMAASLAAGVLIGRAVGYLRQPKAVE